MKYKSIWKVKTSQFVKTCDLIPSNKGRILLKKEDLIKGIKELTKESKYLINLLLEKNVENILEFGDRYQEWYTKAIKIIEFLGRDRLQEFINYYLIDPKRKKSHCKNICYSRFSNGYECK